MLDLNPQLNFYKSVRISTLWCKDGLDVNWYSYIKSLELEHSNRVITSAYFNQHILSAVAFFGCQEHSLQHV
jgi:hypothetical protein